MLHKLKSFLSNVRERLLMFRIEWETYQRIASHIHTGKNHGYPFSDLAGLSSAAHTGYLDTMFSLKIIDQEAQKMGKASGDAFRYIMCRDINCRLARYQKVMRGNFQPTTCDPRFVAKRAC